MAFGPSAHMGPLTTTLLLFLASIVGYFFRKLYHARGRARALQKQGLVSAKVDVWLKR